jgi:hypothetical protein
MIKRSLLVGATIATVTLGGGSLAFAATGTSSSSGESGVSSLVSKLSEKFNLNQAEVQAVFDENREAMQAEREAEQKERLAIAVADGDLTQEQADHIQSVQDEIKALMGDSEPKSASDDIREQIRTKMEELRTWAEENDIDQQYVHGHGGRGHGGGFGGPRGDKADAASSSDGTADSGSSTN